MLSRVQSRYSHRRARAKATPRRTTLRIARPSGALINAVIQHADLIRDLGANQSLLRLSSGHAVDLEVCRALGEEAGRLKDIAVIWNDEEDQIVRVLDAAAGDVLGSVSTMEPLGDREVALTPQALAYLKASQGTLH